MRRPHALLTILALLGHGIVPAASLTTGDGLRLTMDAENGALTEIRVGDTALQLLESAFPLSVQVGTPGEPSTAHAISFESDGGPWVSANNSDWASAVDFVTWLPDGGLDDSGHLLLGNGSSVGVGMALDAPFPVTAGAALGISYQARSASTETLQIVGVRVYDDHGIDITDSVPAPSGWVFSTASQAHVVYGFGNDAPDTWESFSFTYRVPSGAVAALVSVRHWNSGDHLVHIDDLRIDLSGGIVWGEPETLEASPLINGGHVTTNGLLAGGSLSVTASLAASGEALAMRFALQSVPSSHPDRPVRLRWRLPVNLEGWTWWDDIAVSETLAGDAVADNTFTLSQHAISWYPLSAIASGEIGLSLAVPMDEAVVQRFEASASDGLSSAWELGLSPLTEHLGPGHAEVSLLLFRHDGDWGFRSALARYQDRFAEHFAKRTVREGAWEYPVPVSAIASPEDFGFAHYENWYLNWQLQPHERESLRQADVATHFYVEPFMVWDSWFDGPEQPGDETLRTRVEAWADDPGEFATWIADGGLGNTGHLQLGDGHLTGNGMATAQRYPAAPGQTLTLRWQARVADVATKQIVGVRLFDASGADITSTTVAPGGWFYSGASAAHVIAGLANTVPNTWELFERAYVVPGGDAVEAQFSVRHWIEGDHVVQIDDFAVEVSGDPAPLLSWDFNTPTVLWSQARNTDWDAGEAMWILAPRQEMAQAIIESSPHTSSGAFALLEHPSLWRPNDAGTGGSQLWPLNLDPDLPDPSGFSIYHDHWITPSLASDDGIYVDSVAVKWGFGDWLNHRPDHLASVDHPPTFDWRDGHAVQIGFQSQVEFFQTTAPALRDQGHLVMSNLFPEGHRFIAPWSDLMGSEVFDFTEPQERSRIRRAMAGTRIVSNLLQRFMLDEYATHAEMEEFFLSQLFWGFHPAVSSIGKSIGGRPDRYFLHPELYERDRDLFQRYVPVTQELGEAGWQPIPHARGEGLEIERFGSLDRGAALFTVRAADGQPLAATMRIDLPALSLNPTLAEIGLRNVLADADQPHSLLPDGTIETPLALGENEVSVLRLTADSASGFSGH